MRRTLITAATVLLAATSAEAVDRCKVRIDKKNGLISVSASGISGNIRWGKSSGAVTQEFFNAGSCVDGTSASGCQIADPATLAARTPPAGCTIYLADDAAPCSMWISGCSPGLRALDEEGGGLEPTCGNGIGEPGEVCDGLDLAGRTCASEAPATPFGTLTCNETCDAVVTTECLPRFKDNGNGTVSDREFNLMYEKKDNVCPGLHCSTDQYTWSTGDPWAPDGTMFTVFLAGLNDSLFAGYNDWRVPTLNELGYINDLTLHDPSIDQDLFGPTPAQSYWSSDTATVYGESWCYVHIYDHGTPGVSQKFFPHYVRAVRNGF